MDDETLGTSTLGKILHTLGVIQGTQNGMKESQLRMHNDNLDAANAAAESRHIIHTKLDDARGRVVQLETILRTIDEKLEDHVKQDDTIQDAHSRRLNTLEHEVTRRVAKAGTAGIIGGGSIALAFEAVKHFLFTKVP